MLSLQQFCYNVAGYRYVKSERVAEAMLAVDRGLFSSFNPYADSPQSIGYGATISAPHMVFTSRLLINQLINQFGICNEMSMSS